MPREIITVSVGQAGNQIGQRFWELAVQEHAAQNTDGLFHDSMSSFFRNVDSRGMDVGAAAPGRSSASRQPLPIVGLRARAVLVDMEEGVVGSVLRGPLGELFGSTQLLTDVSGSGNNWAHGFGQYGPQYADRLSDVIRGQVEASDRPAGFMLLHSLGGGTGSGLGSYILQQLADEYPLIERFAASVFPSPETDDVVTSPYNATLALAKLAEHADVCLPLDNAALQGICAALEARACMAANGGRGAAAEWDLGARGLPAAAAASRAAGARQAGTMDAMNGVAANCLLNLTASVRFEGQLNLDLNELATNLVPYPRLHFLLASMSPLAPPHAGGRLAAARGIDQALSDVFAGTNQLVKVQAKQHTYLACGLAARGLVTPDELSAGISRIRRQIRTAPWNEDGFKTSICSCPPAGTPYAVLCLANNCAIGATFAGMQQRFHQLYRRRLYLHHYEQYIEAAPEFEAAAEAVQWLQERYSELDDTSQPPNLAQLRPQDSSSYGQNSLRPEPPAAVAAPAARQR